MQNSSAGLACIAYPFLALVVLVIALTVWSMFRATARWKSRQYLASASPRHLGTSMYSIVFNPIRRSMGIRPLRVIPILDAAHRGEVEMLERADRLARDIKDALKHSPVSPTRRSSFERQAREAPDNLVRAMWKLARLRRIADSIDPDFDRAGQNRQTITELQDKLLAEMAHSVEILSAIPVSLMKIEIARGDAAADRLLADLNETNRRLQDMSASYAEIRELP